MVSYKLVQFAETTEASGLGAFNLNLKSFLFQLATFVLVFLVLKKWVFPRLIATLEQRQEVLEKSLVQAKKTQEALSKAEIKAEEIITQARASADEVLAEAKKAATAAIADGEATAAQRAELIVAEAETRLRDERDKLRQELRKELADLVATATEKILQEKLDKTRDKALIERSIKELA